MSRCKKLSEAKCGYVEVLTTERAGSPFGYRLVGASPGPQIVVAGYCSSAELVFDRLLSNPTLAWICGNLVLINLDLLDDLMSELSSIPRLGTTDQTLILPYIDVGDGDEAIVRHSYHMVLRACADLGMIAGPGVASASEKVTDP